MAVAATAVIGARAVDPDDAWYRRLDKPPWQPPGWAFGAVWTPVYASVAAAGGRALRRTGGAPRTALAAGLATNLALNAAWNWMFFRLRSPIAGLVGTLALDASNAHLIRLTARADPTAAALLAPYTAWCAFATVLNADIARRNTRAPRRRNLHRSSVPSQ
ncbi:TspO protein [Embleya scabrispora]|uniref:TspO protein n=2 Tax=Embleya scabrispora TaxID=159449 RepID=A0A1T3P6P0_9ACTN|nr:TspO protein [Embleya scabrispora]